MFSLSSSSFCHHFLTFDDLSKKSQCKHIRFKRAFEFLQLFLLQRVYGIDILTRSSTRQVSTEEQSQYEVFLGGSCNPTTWRREIAIPYFQSYSISYYNPQVCEWTPDLVEIEHKAKEAARLLFFVIDNHTRALAAIAETAYLSARGRAIIVIISSMPRNKNQTKFIQQKKFPNEKDDIEDYENACEARKTLRLLIQTKNIPVFDNIKVGLECARFIIKTKHQTKVNCDTSDEEDNRNNNGKMSRLSSNKTSFESPDNFYHEVPRLSVILPSRSPSYRRHSATTITSNVSSNSLAPYLRSINLTNGLQYKPTKSYTKSQISCSTNESDDDGYGSLISSNYTLSRSSSSCLAFDGNENFSEQQFEVNTSKYYLPVSILNILISVCSAYSSLMSFSTTSNISMIESIYILCTVSFRLIHTILAPPSKSLVTFSKKPNRYNSSSYMFDLYIASGTEDEHWLNTYALPILKEFNLKYAKRLTYYDNDQSDIVYDIHIRKHSHLLYYLINDTERLSNLVTELAFLIGERKYHIIVCLQPRIDDSTDKILTKNERQDIERSRKYLEAIATKENILLCQSRDQSWQLVLAFLLKNP